MDAIKHALQGQLEETIERLKGMGGAVVFEDYPGALEDDGQGDAGGDGASITGERELAFDVRGTCEICGESIAPGRLRAIPEVTTCVVCQDAEERRARVSPERMSVR